MLHLLRPSPALLLSALLSSAMIAAAYAQDPQASNPVSPSQALLDCAKYQPPPPHSPLCSYTGINRSCTVQVDRFNAIAPPTIYVKRGASVTVELVRSSPFETATLDLKSTTATVPPDSFGAILSALTGFLTKSPISLVQGKVPQPPRSVNPSLVPTLGEKLDAIDHEQQTLLAELNVDGIVRQLALVTQPPSGNVCAPNPDPDYPNPWMETDDWVSAVGQAIDQAIETYKRDRGRVAALQQSIDALKPPDDCSKLDLDPDAISFCTIKGTQAQLRGLVAPADKNSYTAEVPARLALIRDSVLRPIPDKGKPATFVIVDPVRHDRNFELLTESLNTLNEPAPVLKRVTASASVNGPVVLTAPPDSSAKQPLLAIAVQYESAPRVELSTGLIVPLRPYHQYSTAAVASGGAVTANQVVETTNFGLVPAANVSVLLYELTGQRTRMAALATVAVGYNTATSNVEFAVGPTFAIKSIEVSGLLDVGRDTRLTGGFTVGQQFPAASTPKPTTEVYWSFKPAVGLSVRIPLGGK